MIVSILSYLTGKKSVNMVDIGNKSSGEARRAES